MQFALLCVFFTHIITREGCRAVEEDDFRPTPIPLNDWRHDKRGGRAASLHNIFKPDAPTVAALPAHYWEDALKHSVYLTLVRDKIDELIAKGLVVSPNGSPEQHFSGEVDDHDLWEKIKSAPFDRAGEQEVTSIGDVQIMAKGRLLEENGGFRFTEDEASSKKCTDDSCARGVKAFWSVKRVRQTDDDSSPEKYHYEMTFSVTSQTPKKKRKPYENPIRTFTMRETPPTHDHWGNGPVIHAPRTQRAIWFHKNINVPTQQNHRHPHNQNLDRIFSSFFSDDDFFDDPPPFYKPNPYTSRVFPPTHSKQGYVGPQSELLHQKKLMPYPYKSQSFKFSRPLLPPPLQHTPHPQNQFLEISIPFHHHHPHIVSSSDQGYMSSNTVKTTRPAFLPTPVTIPFTKNESMDAEDTYFNATETTSKKIETEKESNTIFTIPLKQRPSAIKLNYFPGHLRPPIFHTPPGVFVTMDKKPFKPMPPLKLSHVPKIGKPMPIDFRPSPQVLDVQFSDPEPSPDAEFRPITIGYVDKATPHEKNVTISHNADRKQRPLNKNNKKNTKLHTHKSTTYEPDIITAHYESSDNTESNMEYTNIIGAFTRTTPMASQTEKSKTTEIVMSTTTTPVSMTTTTTSATSATLAATTSKPEPSTASTVKPKKRTRPPPKFNKHEKKHKRVTSTTAKPTTVTDTPAVKKSEPDLTPQASSASLGNNKQFPNYKNNATSTTPVSKEDSTTSTRATTSLKPLTTTTTITEATTTSTLPTTTTKESPLTITQYSRKNRFRQSTLMHKGTSVKHDRWSAALERNRTVPLSKQFPRRRKGSNFHGYVSATPKTEDRQVSKDDHQDHETSTFTTIVSSTIEVSTANNVEITSQPTHPTYEEETVDQYETGGEATSDYVHKDGKDDPDNMYENNEDQETKDQSEYIFTGATTSNEKINDVEQEKIPTTTEEIVSWSSLAVKKKMKCKKKRPQNVNTTDEAVMGFTEAGNILTNISTTPLTLSTITTTTTENAVTPDIIDELLGAFTYDEPSDKATEVQTTPKPDLIEAESENIEKYVHSHEDFEDFLGSLEEKENDNDVDESEYDENVKDLPYDDEGSFFREDDNETERETRDYTDYQEHPYSLLELMTMK